jgi:hypothetical protein
LRFFPAGLPAGRLLPGLGLERVLEAGLLELNFGLGFQPGPAFLSAREVELG